MKYFFLWQRILILGIFISFAAFANGISPSVQQKKDTSKNNDSLLSVIPDSDALPERMQQKALKPPGQKQLWNLKDADIRAVIQTVSLLTGKNFIIDPQVSGKVTLISQQPMTIDEMYQVFLSMLQVLGYAAVPSGDVIKIVPAMNAKELAGPIATKLRPGKGDEVVVRVIPVNRISAPQLIPVLRPLMQEWGSISAYTPSNSLIMVGNAANIQRLVELVRRMDNERANSISVVRLKHANANQVVSVLSSLQEADRAEGKVSNVSLVADPGNNSILVSGNLVNQMLMRSLIRRLDTRSSATGNTVVVHLNYLDAKKLAPILTKIVRGQEEQTTTGKNGSQVAVTGNPEISIQPEENDNAVIIHAPKTVIQSLQQVIRKLDNRPSEVLVQAIIVKINESLMNQLGIVWTSIDSQGNPTVSGNNTVALQIFKGFGFIKNGNLEALVHLLMQHGSTDILATPSVVVLNNQKASIDDGKNIGIINRQYSTNQLGTDNFVVPFNTFQRTDVTLSLKVTPQISPNNMLRLKIDQKDDELDIASTTDPDNPVINTSRITTNVLVHSGDILVLGGLIDNDQEKNVSKIPILGDIPLLGHLFRFTDHTYEKRDLMIFIRPIILLNKSVARHATMKNYNFVRREQINAENNTPLRARDFPILPHLGKLIRIPPPMMTYDEKSK